MDIFGIGAAFKAMGIIYQQSGRRCGKTESLINILKDGDMVIFNNNNEADRVEKLCRARGIKIKYKVLSSTELYKLKGDHHLTGRLMFDHSWVEQYYMDAIEQCEKDINHFESLTPDTDHKKYEMDKWIF